MNKRIAELISEAYIKVPHERDWDATSTVFDKQKFAELIIKECISVVEEQHDPWNLNYSPKHRASDAIKLHFGIK